MVYPTRFFIVTALCTLLIAGCTKQSDVLIGGLFPLTGNAATFGQSSKQGMQLAIDEINTAGGIEVDGVKRLLKGVYEDDEGNPEKAANACQKLISQDGIVALCGAVMSKNSMAIAPLCQQAGVPMVSPASTNIKVTEAGDFIYRACFIDPFQGAVMATYAFSALKARTAGVIFDNGNDYNKGLAEVFKQKFEALGGKVVAWEAFTDEANTVDFKAQLTNIKSAQPDFLYSPNYYSADALIMKQAREIGCTVPAGGGDGWDSPELVAIGKKNVEGCVFSNHFSKDDTSVIVQNFVKNYRDRFGAGPDALASLAYDAATIIASAIKAAASVEGIKIRDALKSVTVQGVSGAISFDEKRNPIKSAVVLKIENGAQKYVMTIAP